MLHIIYIWAALSNWFINESDRQDFSIFFTIGHLRNHHWICIKNKSKICPIWCQLINCSQSRINYSNAGFGGNCYNYLCQKNQRTISVGSIPNKIINNISLHFKQWSIIRGSYIDVKPVERGERYDSFVECFHSL